MDCHLFNRCNVNYFRAAPDKPCMCLRQTRRVAWSIVSKAAERSSKIVTEDIPFHNENCAWLNIDLSPVGAFLF